METLKIAFLDDSPEYLQFINENVQGFNKKSKKYKIKPRYFEHPSLFIKEYQGDCDAVVTDIHMPMMNGLEIADHVMENFPKNVIMLISGSIKIDDKLDSLICKGNFRVSELVGKVKTLLREPNKNIIEICLRKEYYGQRL